MNIIARLLVAPFGVLDEAIESTRKKNKNRVIVAGRIGMCSIFYAMYTVGFAPPEARYSSLSVQQSKIAREAADRYHTVQAQSILHIKRLIDKIDKQEKILNQNSLKVAPREPMTFRRYVPSTFPVEFHLNVRPTTYKKDKTFLSALSLNVSWKLYREVTQVPIITKTILPKTRASVMLNSPETLAHMFRTSTDVRGQSLLLGKGTYRSKGSSAIRIQLGPGSFTKLMRTPNEAVANLPEPSNSSNSGEGTTQTSINSEDVITPATELQETTRSNSSPEGHSTATEEDLYFSLSHSPKDMLIALKRGLYAQIAFGNYFFIKLIN